MTDAEMTARIEDAADSPVKIAGDAIDVTERSIGELIKADRYLAAKRASSKAHFGLRFSQISHPGAQ